MAWTDEAIAIIRKRHPEGVSATEIAKEIGRAGQGTYTRNAVIGKIHRLGLVPSGTPRRKAPPSNRSLQDRVKAVRAPVPTPVDTQARMLRADIEQARALPPLLRIDPVLKVRDAQCRYPYGDPLKEDFAMCGRDVASHGPYCTDHARLCYTPTAPRKRAGGEQDGRLSHALALTGGV